MGALALACVAAGCVGDGRDHVESLLGLEAQDYRGVVSGFEDTIYSARFVTTAAEVDAAARRLGLDRTDDLPFSGEPPGGPGTRDRTRLWWHPADDLAGGVFYRSSAPRADGWHTMALGVNPETGVAYAYVFYP